MTNIHVLYNVNSHLEQEILISSYEDDEDIEKFLYSSITLYPNRPANINIQIIMDIHYKVCEIVTASTRAASATVFMVLHLIAYGFALLTYVRINNGYIVFDIACTICFGTFYVIVAGLINEIIKRQVSRYYIVEDLNVGRRTTVCDHTE